MCEYDPACTKSDDPTAMLLWSRKNDASLLVTCNALDPCPIAAVFDLASGRYLCTPHFRVQAKTMYVDPQEPAADLHFHAGLDLVDSLAPDDWEYGRCRHGLWMFTAGMELNAGQWSPTTSKGHVRARKVFPADHRVSTSRRAEPEDSGNDAVQ